MFPCEQKTQPSTSFKTSGQDFQTLNQTIGWDFEVFETKDWAQCLKSLAACVSYNTWVSYMFFQSVLFWSHFYCLYLFIVFMWVAARYLQHGKCNIWKRLMQCYLKSYNIVLNKDKNAYIVFCREEQYCK